MTRIQETLVGLIRRIGEETGEPCDLNQIRDQWDGTFHPSHLTTAVQEHLVSRVGRAGKYRYFDPKNPPREPTELVTSYEVARKHNMPPGTLRNWLQEAGATPCKIIGRRHFWESSVVQEVVDKHWPKRGWRYDASRRGGTTEGFTFAEPAPEPEPNTQQPLSAAISVIQKKLEEVQQTIQQNTLERERLEAELKECKMLRVRLKESISALKLGLEALQLVEK